MPLPSYVFFLGQEDWILNLDFLYTISFQVPSTVKLKTQENENVRAIKDEKIVLKVSLRLYLTILGFYSQTLLFYLTFSGDSSIF